MITYTYIYLSIYLSIPMKYSSTPPHVLSLSLGQDRGQVEAQILKLRCSDATGNVFLMAAGEEAILCPSQEHDAGRTGQGHGSTSYMYSLRRTKTCWICCLMTEEGERSGCVPQDEPRGEGNWGQGGPVCHWSLVWYQNTTGEVGSQGEGGPYRGCEFVHNS